MTHEIFLPAVIILFHLPHLARPSILSYQAVTPSLPQTLAFTRLHIHSNKQPASSTAAHLTLLALHSKQAKLSYGSQLSAADYRHNRHPASHASPIPVLTSTASAKRDTHTGYTASFNATNPRPPSQALQQHRFANPALFPVSRGHRCNISARPSRSVFFKSEP
ncbi:hypothetical protein NLG97_g9548 [Lecanicillium saksenae]|uniref:Uncharacterized protein n=1 Tax=Lecanicillium saksenae TaxID=468837 RepID=A0ACC1QJN0_9HYPO|nr:hypothetical protein NLG97_g9548 [Lecanicillium saksenae]